MFIPSVGIKQYWFHSEMLFTGHCRASHASLCSKWLPLSSGDLSSCGTRSDASHHSLSASFLGAPHWLCRIRLTQPFVCLFTAAHELGAALTLSVCYSFFGRRTITTSFCRCGYRCVSDRMAGSHVVCLKEDCRKFSWKSGGSSFRDSRRNQGNQLIVLYVNYSRNEKLAKKRGDEKVSNRCAQQESCFFDIPR